MGGTKRVLGLLFLRLLKVREKDPLGHAMGLGAAGTTTGWWLMNYCQKGTWGRGFLILHKDTSRLLHGR